MIIHLGSMLPLTSSGYPGTRRAHLSMSPILPCSRWGLPSSISHLMDWCAFTAPFHLYNVLARCSLLSVALSIALPLLGITQHPAPWSPDFPHPLLGTRPSTQLKHFLRIPYIALGRQYKLACRPGFFSFKNCQVLVLTNSLDVGVYIPYDIPFVSIWGLLWQYQRFLDFAIKRGILFCCVLVW